MSTITVTKTYQDAAVLYEADLDGIVDSTETFVNVTGIGDDNIQNATLTGDLLDSNSLTSTQIATSAVTTAKIAELGITTAKLAADSVTEAKLATNAVTTAKIQDGQVLTANIETSQVTTAKIANTNITAALINNNDITTPKIADASILTVKKPALNYAQSATANYSMSSTTPGNAGISATITTTGNPVYVFGQPTPNAAEGYFGISRGSVGMTSNYGAGGVLTLKRDTTTIAQYQIAIAAPNPSLAGIQNLELALPPGVIAYIDHPAAGTYSYEIELSAFNQTPFSNNTTIQIQYFRLNAVEID